MGDTADKVAVESEYGAKESIGVLLVGVSTVKCGCNALCEQVTAHVIDAFLQISFVAHNVVFW